MDLNFAENIITILDYIAKKLGIAVNWGSDNVLPYLRELADKYISYRITSSILYIIITTIISIFIIIGFIAFIKWANKSDYEFEYGTIILVIFIFIAALLTCLAIISYNAYIIIECKTFPEKVIYDYIVSLNSNK